MCGRPGGQWIKLPPGNARGDTEPLGGADGCLLPAANRNAPAVFGCSVREAPEVVHWQGREQPCVFSCDHVRWACGGGAARGGPCTLEADRLVALPLRCRCSAAQGGCGGDAHARRIAARREAWPRRCIPYESGVWRCGGGWWAAMVRHACVYVLCAVLLCISKIQLAR